jgi:4-azaleucine resistance transporter AzlC
MTGRDAGREVLRGTAEFSPLALILFSYGAIFGVLAQRSGLTVAEASLMSLTVFAGASQFIALPMIRDGVSGWALVLMAFMVNLRHLLYGLSIGRLFPQAPRGQLLALSHGLIDENYAFVTLGPGRARATPLYFLGTGICAYLGWNAGTLLGAVAGARLPFIWKEGLDFVVLAVFLSLVGVSLRKGEDWAVMAGAAGVAVLVHRQAGGYWHLLAAGVAVPLLFATFDALRSKGRQEP